MAAHTTPSASLPNYVMIAAFLFILVILWVFGDTFTALVGTIIEGLIFALNYKSDDEHAHH